MSERPSAAAIEAARESVIATYKRWGEQAEDIASEALVRALERFDPSRGTLFGGFVMACAANIEREFAKAARRAQGQRIDRVQPPDDLAPILKRMSPTEFALWFDATCREIWESSAHRDVVAALVCAATEVLRLVHSLDPDVALDPSTPTDGGPEGRRLVWALVMAAQRELVGHALVTPDVLLRGVLAAVGIKGDAFDRWLGGVRERRRKLGAKEGLHAGIPDQVITWQNFLAERCSVGPGEQVRAAELRRAYEDYCRARGQKPVPPADFGNVTKTFAGVTCERDKKGLKYRGIGLAPRKRGRPRKM